MAAAGPPAQSRHPKDENILRTADLQSLADLANSFEVIEAMRPSLQFLVNF